LTLRDNNKVPIWLLIAHGAIFEMQLQIFVFALRLSTFNGNISGQTSGIVTSIPDRLSDLSFSIYFELTKNLWYTQWLNYKLIIKT